MLKIIKAVEGPLGWSLLVVSLIFGLVASHLPERRERPVYMTRQAQIVEAQKSLEFFRIVKKIEKEEGIKLPW